MNTYDFKTKTQFVQRSNASVKGHWPIAIDIGYSAVKGFAPNGLYCFPSFARRIEDTEQLSSFGTPKDTDIQYRDEDGNVWDVGALAINMVKKDDTRESSQSLYGRNRYFNPMFKVVARVGIALGLLPNEFGNPKDRHIIVQTGLPPAYIKMDSGYLKDVISGHHKFDIKVGKGKWKSIEYNLVAEDIKIMAQPMGSLFSSSITNDCVNTPEANNYFNSGLLVFDGGFGTLDTFSLRQRHIESSETYDDLAMKMVFQKTSEEIFKRFNTEIPVHVMQQSLTDGTISTFDRKTMKTTKVDISGIIDKYNREICENAIERIKSVYNNLLDYRYLLVTGGTGSAWFDIIKTHFAGMSDLQVINGWQNDNILPIFSNVRGYYLYCVGLLRAQNKE